jgi:transcriptional regulator of acetoin/glycerol metabolism
MLVREREKPRTLDSIVTAAIIESLERNEHHVGKTARELGMGRTTLYRKLKSWGSISRKADTKGTDESS